MRRLRHVSLQGKKAREGNRTEQEDEETEVPVSEGGGCPAPTAGGDKHHTKEHQESLRDVLSTQAGRELGFTEPM